MRFYVNHLVVEWRKIDHWNILDRTTYDGQGTKIIATAWDQKWAEKICALLNDAEAKEECDDCNS